MMPRNVAGFLRIAALSVLAAMTSQAAVAGGGYFALGYGPMARQMGGATTAVTGDAYAGASNPAKLIAAGNRTDVGIELFMPTRRVERSGSGTPFDFDSTSRGSLFLIPEAAASWQLNNDLAVGFSFYGNGGLNTEYRDDNGVPGVNGNPAACGAAPGNILLGCGKAGFDLTQLVFAPTVAWRINDKHALGVSPLLVAQRFEAYGLQAFAPSSKYPTKVTNNGHDVAFGAGVRIGWYGEFNHWLSAGIGYSSRVYMEEFDRYKGLFAEGSFDIPANYSAGIALRPTPQWLVSLDVQRIEFGEVNSLSNGVLNSLPPGAQPMGSADGSGFNWRSRNTYRIGIAYEWSPTLTLRGGFAYGKRPNDESINSVTFNLLAPNPHRAYSAGLTWKPSVDHELHVAMGHFVEQTYRGPSATAGVGVGGTEEISPHVEMLMVGWTWKR
jgi:long-chain fatty acid transport protein